MSLGGLKLRVHGPMVTALFTVNGQEFALQDLPWDAAKKISEAFGSAAKEAEEYAKANEIIMDQAILFRSGAPIALTNHPKMREEALKEAVWDRDLRRSNLQLSGNIESHESVGRPTVTQSPPPAQEPIIIIPK